MQLIKLLIILLSILMIAGCPASKSGSVYSREQARQTQYVETGRVVEVREVLLEGTKSDVGSLGGAAIGGIAGSNIGGGRGAAIATILGAIAGGVAGAMVEEGVTQKTALEIVVRLDSGRTIAVVQTEDEITFQPNEPVRVLIGAEATRVTKITR
jgi:outer membrane lipoprotein SlyB